MFEPAMPSERLMLRPGGELTNGRARLFCLPRQGSPAAWRVPCGSEIPQ